jgi:hypothetical protein
MMARAILDPDDQGRFGAHYPLAPMRFSHNLGAKGLFGIEALAQLALSLPTTQVERRFADNRPDSDFRKMDMHDMAVDRHIRSIAENPAWIMLANIQSDARYRTAIAEIIGALAPQIEMATGPIRNLTGFVFISSQGAVTPLHFDPEYNLFFQLEGSKAFTLFPADGPLVSARTHEALHVGGDNMLRWSDRTNIRGDCHALRSGAGLFVPYKAPHWVEVGDAVSISLSVTWKSDWCFDQEYGHRFNARLRGLGFSPAPLPAWPRRAGSKSLGGRLLDRIGLMP